MQVREPAARLIKRHQVRERAHHGLERHGATIDPAHRELQIGRLSRANRRRRGQRETITLTLDCQRRTTISERRLPRGLFAPDGVRPSRSTHRHIRARIEPARRGRGREIREHAIRAAAVRRE